MSTVIEPAESVRSIDADSIYENRTENEDDRVALTEGPVVENANGGLHIPSDSSVWAKMDLIVLPVTTMMFFLSSLVSSLLYGVRFNIVQEVLMTLMFPRIVQI